MEYFLSPQHEVQDDLLFFVRQFVPSFKSSTGSINDLEPVFVKRRVPGVIPSLSDVVDWKSSFFLNLISQLPCTLGVSVCSRYTPPKTETVLMNNESIESLDDNKSKMVANTRITKKVYAAPYKSRMDVRDAVMNECSYPVVYYTVNDYESDDLHLTITEKEYLCVELSMTLPNDPTSENYKKATECVEKISLQQDNSPFPLPSGYSKVILFQGAVSFNSLVDIYQQKGIAAQNQLRNGWGKGGEVVGPRKEYIMMRGPQGKGQCQVAIADPEPLLEPPPTFLKTISSVFKSISPQDPSLPRPTSLVCSMTYVNVPLQSISTDLIAFQKRG